MTQIQAQQTLNLLSELDYKKVSNEQQLLAKVKTKNSQKNPLDKILSPSMAPAKTCYSLGPILDENESNKLKQKLKQNGFQPKHKAITDKEPKSYWVYFPVEKTLADAKAVVNQLRDANVDDYFIVRKGKFTNAISMGLYNSYSRAKIRMRGLRKLGFNPKVQTRYKDVTRHWLDFQETDSKRLDTSVWENVQKDNPLQKLARPCVASKSKTLKKN
ncbi:MAG: SPOR domain-containing protein [Pseudomonadota bacterium]